MLSNWLCLQSRAKNKRNLNDHYKKLRPRSQKTTPFHFLNSSTERQSRILNRGEKQAPTFAWQTKLIRGSFYGSDTETAWARVCVQVCVHAAVRVCDTVTQPVGGLSSTSKDSASLECEQSAGPSSSFTTRLDINKHTHTGMQDELCLWTDKVSFHARRLSNQRFLLHMRKKVSIAIFLYGLLFFLFFLFFY